MEEPPVRAILEFRRSLELEYLSTTCARCGAVALEAGSPCSTCKGTDRLTWDSLNALRHADPDVYIGHLSAMTDHVRAGLEAAEVEYPADERGDGEEDGDEPGFDLREEE